MNKDEKKAMKTLLVKNKMNETNTIEINAQMAECIHIVWQSYVIQSCFFEQNMEFAGFFKFFLFIFVF